MVSWFTRQSAIAVRVQSDIRQHTDRRVRATEARFGTDCLHFGVRNMPGGAVKEPPYCVLPGAIRSRLMPSKFCKVIFRSE